MGHCHISVKVEAFFSLFLWDLIVRYLYPEGMGGNRLLLGCLVTEDMAGFPV